MNKPNKNLIPFQFCDEKNPFAVPAGRYRAKLRSISMVNNVLTEANDGVRFLFDITNSNEGPVDYMIKKVYKKEANEYPDLQPDLKAFFTVEEYEDLKRDRKHIDLCELEGRTVDLLVVTKKGHGYPVPFSMIQAMYSPGTLLPDQNSPSAVGMDDSEDKERC